MLTRLRRRAKEMNDDAGITLIELLVAMSLSTVIGAMALSAFLVMSNVSGRTVDRNIAVANARNAIQDWTALLQVADSPTTPGQTTDRITSVSGTEIVFFADISNRDTDPSTNCPTRLDLSLVGNRLVEKRTKLSGTECATAGVTSTRYVADDVRANGPVFTLYNADGSQESGTDYSNVVRVDVSFEVQTRTDATAQTFNSTAALTGASS